MIATYAKMFQAIWNEDHGGDILDLDDMNKLYAADGPNRAIGSSNQQIGSQGKKAFEDYLDKLLKEKNLTDQQMKRQKEKYERKMEQMRSEYKKKADETNKYFSGKPREEVHIPRDVKKAAEEARAKNGIDEVNIFLRLPII
uniref:Uncharacterized protein n=1 Tax=Acrobeloides nanus TaxID=290746 RepID=A0A914BY27_9BILA